MNVEPPPAAPPLGYMKQLDALRGIAIALVLVEHFLPADTSLRRFPWGSVGVQLFFTISGYLITLILLDARKAGEAGRGKGFVLRNFYMRRFLRIFPIYYLTLAVAFIGGVPAVRDAFWWHFAYLSNWYFVFFGPREPVFHLWSLSVEEQFYLVWPWLIIFLPQSWLYNTIRLIIITAPAVRYGMVQADFPSLAVAWATPSCLDTLGIGALLALVTRHPEIGLPRRQFLRGCLFVGLPLTALLLPMYNPLAPTAIGVVFFNTALALVFVWIVGGAATGFRGLGGKLLQQRPLIALGRISYGVYLYHLFIPWALEHWGVSTDRFGAPGQFALFTLLTIVVAAMSWTLVEKPLNNLKRYFPAG